METGKNVRLSGIVEGGERYVSLDGRGRRDDGLPLGPLGDSRDIGKRVNRIMG
jgi:hypothetical protein